ncbi:hypothetical protein PHMEG_00026253 [Phytophthora megakarya]|uniref:Uncharacterized protein n=1 Tax=Phytophthora megakarya TaxID=4795 RepID=A0A225VA16_9STRA|nr:hypothetical protein PHMEG_00026253 [Phytophthora megakarya]
MTADAKSGDDLEKFKGKSYAMWKDKLLTHVNQLDHEYLTKLLEKRQPEPRVLMTDFLRTNPENPVSPNTETDEQEALAMMWDVMYWKRGRGGLQNLLNQVLPDFFLSTLPDVVSSMDPYMVTETWLCVEALSQLPSEFWASSISMKKEDFTMDQVEGALRRVFGDKSKKEMILMDKTQAITANNTVVADGETRLNRSGNTVLEQCQQDQTMDDIESLNPAHNEGFEDNGNSAETPTGSPQSMGGIQAEVAL